MVWGGEEDGKTNFNEQSSSQKGQEYFLPSAHSSLIPRLRYFRSKLRRVTRSKYSPL